MKHKSIVITAILVVLQLCSSLSALPTTASEAEMVVKGWLKTDPQPLNTALGQEVTGVETFTDDNGEPVYYIVYLEPSGFVIVSADDLIEPIIGFVCDGTYDPSLENPLGALVTNDLNGRMSTVQSSFSLLAVTPQVAASKTQKKWSHLICLAETSSGGFELMSEPPIRSDWNVDDIRVAPLVKSKWGQKGVYSSSGASKYCYNYYTPQHYRSGCVATAMAQLMRYHEYPREGIRRKRFQIKVDGNDDLKWTRGGDSNGGTYNWGLMVLEPNYNTPLEQRKAIGALCHDAGLSVNMDYNSDGSSADTLEVADALQSVFKYANAIKGFGSDNNIGSGLIGMINPNLDAKKPVILGVWGDGPQGGGHTVVCDGYGYDSSTMYHHLNMGWSGDDDCWYNLPNIDCVDQPYKFTALTKCVYNILESGNGEIISGRVLYDNGEPVKNVSVYRLPSDSGDPCAVSTDSNGIFSFDKLDPNTTYTISACWSQTKLEEPEEPLDISDLLKRPKQGLIVMPQLHDASLQVRTGSSRDYGSTAGNVWGVYFHANPPKLYVDDNANNDPWPNNPNFSDPYEDGSAEHPFDTIQEAIDAAMPGDTVIILEGIYKGDGNRDLDFKCKPITVQNENLYNPDVVANTIINCEGSQSDPHRGFRFHSGEKAVSVVKGLTITGGYHSEGGGIYCINDSSPTIANCLFESNEADKWGGGIFSYKSSPTITNCTFSRNSATYSGGGMHNEHSSPTVVNCTFRENRANEYGGGIEDYDSDATVINCRFIGNEADKDGGGMDNNDSNPTVTNCTFSGNKAAEFGGGMCNYESSPTLTNCTFSGNSANYISGNRGGGIENYDSNASITNCIVWGNSGGQISGSATVSYSDIQGDWPGEGNIDADPQFVDPDGADDIPGTQDDNLRLFRWSRCINAGNNSSVTPDTADLDGDGNTEEPIPFDLDRDPRIVDTRVDMGAYEYLLWH